ncbi:MAG: xanthine dehydrogenase small subunit [Alphaproteobacteria bacterium]|nr:xanthine dehydrogenase small subunit [Alphaproteobacteria bacterium]
MTRSVVRFLLGEEVCTLTDIDPTATLLDWLRATRRSLGTKEGCAEGDCGACTVVVGTPMDGTMRYACIDSCIRFLPTLDGCQVLTVEHLAREDGTLHPVQQALMDCHGSQCGFCTPGFVMALFALWLNAAQPDRGAIEAALQGNLCRCTGYAPILAAAERMYALGDRDADRWRTGGVATAARLAAFQDGETIALQHGGRRFFAPADAEALAAILLTHPDATIAAGATDVGLWVTKAMRVLDPLVYIGRIAALRTIAETAEQLELGALVSYTEAWPAFARLHPELGRLLRRIGGAQVRNAGTIGGNIANGSPIGDTPPPLIALGAEIVLRKGDTRRTLALEDFFIAYGRQDRAPGEFLECLRIPRLPPDALFAVYKVSKRRDEDISALCGAFRIDRDADGRITQARVAFGGMAATPKRAPACETELTGAMWTQATTERAAAALDADFAPLSDWRASAAYRSQAARGLLMRFYLETAGGESLAHLDDARSAAHA